MNDPNNRLEDLSRRRQEHLAQRQAEDACDRQEQEAGARLQTALGRATTFRTPTYGHAPPEGVGFTDYGRLAELDPSLKWDTREVAPPSDPRWLE